MNIHLVVVHLEQKRRNETINTKKQIKHHLMVFIFHFNIYMYVCMYVCIRIKRNNDNNNTI